VIGEIYKFGNDLLSIGQNMSCPSLSAYAHELCEYADNFEVDKLMRTLKMFPEVINRIKAIRMV
jgi:hypothetical protein